MINSFDDGMQFADSSKENQPINYTLYKVTAIGQWGEVTFENGRRIHLTTVRSLEAAQAEQAKYISWHYDDVQIEVIEPEKPVVVEEVEVAEESSEVAEQSVEASEASTTEVETVDQIRKEVPMFQVFKKAFGKEEEIIYSGDDASVAKEQVAACKGSVERVQTKVNGAWTHNPELSWDDYEQYRKDLKAGKFDAGFERDERNV